MSAARQAADVVCVSPASASAARLALGQALPEALDLAQSYCHAALADAYAIAPGQLMPQRFFT